MFRRIPRTLAKELLDSGLLDNNPETLNRLRWTAPHFRIGIMLEE